MRHLAIILLFNFFICPLTVTGQTRKSQNITWQKFQSSGPDLKQIGWLAVKHSRDIKSSSWSVGCETLDRDQAKFSVYKDYVGELGVKHGRLQSGWAKCEKQKGVYSFEWLDSCVYGLNEQSVKPWICLCYGNPVYGSDMNLGSEVAKLVNSEEAMAAWLRYVEKTVNRYKNVVNEWEVWNEPYYQEKDYAPLLIKTAELIRKIQPESIILGEILWDTKEPGIKILLDALKSNNKLDLVDYWVYHPYINNPDECYPILDDFITLLKSYNPKYKIYQGEVGCPSQLEWEHALAYYPWTEYSQVKWVLRRMAGDRVRNIPSSVFTIIDLRYPNMLQSFGLIRSNLLHEIIYKRPSYYGVQNMVSFFDDMVKAVGESEYESNSSRKMTIAGFKKEESSVILIWYKDQIPGDDIKWDLVDLTIKNTNFQDPVYIEMITGKVYEIDKSSWQNEGKNIRLKNLPVWDSPVMITERSQVELTPEEAFADSDKPDTIKLQNLKLTIPWGYNKTENAGRKYPIVVNGNWGEGNLFSEDVRKKYPSFYLDFNHHTTESDGAILADLIDEAIRMNYRIDTNRIYLTGFSAGGSGSFKIVRGMLSRGKLFAGIVRVAGQSESVLADEAVKKTSLWYHIGLNDVPERIDVARATYMNLKGKTANATAVESITTDNITGYTRITKTLTRNGIEIIKMSEYEGLGHEPGPCYKDPALFDWLFSQSLAHW